MVSPAEPQHRLVIQVDQNDRRTMDFALNNATDVIEHYRGLDQTVAVEIMACGPGLHMLRIDTSPVKERIKQIRETAPPAGSSSRPATTPSRVWRRRKAMAIRL